MITQPPPQSNTQEQLTIPFATLEYAERHLPIYCPQCSLPIQVTKGLCGNRLIDAIMLQAERVGAELHCDQCQHTFVYHQVRTLGESLDGSAVTHR